MASSSQEGEKDPDGKPKHRSIADVLKSFVVLLERGNSVHLKESVASELQHIADEAELVDRADGKFRRKSSHSTYIGCIANNVRKVR